MAGLKVLHIVTAGDTPQQQHQQQKQQHQYKDVDDKDSSSSSSNNKATAASFVQVALHMPGLQLLSGVNAGSRRRHTVRVSPHGLPLSV
jgi:hypothetical protein